MKNYMYSIICDARKGRSKGITHLALVDRAKTKDTWWTSDNMNLILNYKKKSAAEFAVNRLTKNNAHIVFYKEAKNIIRRQSEDIMLNECSEEAELGTFGYKSV